MKHTIITALKSIENVWRRFGARHGTEGGWCKDPLSHPDIARMSERERADLQFQPERVESE